MYFLHTEAREAAYALCVQDLSSTLNKAVAALKYAHKERQASSSLLYKWVVRSADNYCWLGLFAYHLGIRISSQKAFVTRHHSAIWNLRVSVPLRLRRFGTVDDFPNIFKLRISKQHAPNIVAACRLAYLDKRRHNAKWGKVGAPGWFARMAYTVPAARRGSKTTLRNFASGLSRSEHSGRSVAEW